MLRLSLLLFIHLGLAVNAFNAQAQETPDSLHLNQLISYAYNAYLYNPDSSIALSQTVLQHALKSKITYFEGYSYFVLSKAHWAKANYSLSTEYGFQALNIFENSPYINLWGECLTNQARSCMDLRTFSQARKFLNLAERLALQYSDSRLQAAVHRERSFLLLEEHQYDSALYYADKSLAFYTETRDTLYISILFGRKARIYFNKRDYIKSSDFIRKALMMDSLVNNRRALGISYFQAAQTLYRLHKTDSAILFLKKSFPINIKIHNLTALVRGHDLLAQIYSDQKNTALAVEHLKLASMYKDSLYISEKNGHIQEMQALYDLESKDKRIQMLAQENALNEQQVKTQRLYLIFLAVGMILLVAFILVLSRLRKLQSKVNQELTTKNIAIEHQKEEIHAQAENLQQLNQVKSKLFSVVSHDLRGPISNLQVLLELLTQKALAPEEFLVLSEKLKSNLKVTQGTLENLLNWSLSQMEGIKTMSKVFDIKNTTYEVCKLMEEAAYRKNVLVENTLANSINVFADLNQTHLILRNLLHNAIKFSNADGRVIISASVLNSHCSMKIKDFGIGMTSDEISMILNSQEYFTKSGTEQEKGTGLGMLLCKEFIHRNGGILTIESRVGHGTEISFTLPTA